MDKYGVDKSELIDGLRDEEAKLMQQIQGLMSRGDMEKTAEERSRIDSRLQQVRAKITELDLKNG